MPKTRRELNTERRDAFMDRFRQKARVIKSYMAYDRTEKEEILINGSRLYKNYNSFKRCQHYHMRKL